MRKESYTIYQSCKSENSNHKPANRRQNNNDYKLCICSMLVFFVLCLLIILIASTFGNNSASKKNHVESFSSDKLHDSEKTERPIEIHHTFATTTVLTDVTLPKLDERFQNTERDVILEVTDKYPVSKYAEKIIQENTTTAFAVTESTEKTVARNEEKKLATAEEAKTTVSIEKNSPKGTEKSHSADTEMITTTVVPWKSEIITKGVGVLDIEATTTQEGTTIPVKESRKIDVVEYSKTAVVTEKSEQKKEDVIGFDQEGTTTEEGTTIPVKKSSKIAVVEYSKTTVVTEKSEQKNKDVTGFDQEGTTTEEGTTIPVKKSSKKAVVKSSQTTVVTEKIEQTKEGVGGFDQEGTTTKEGTTIAVRESSNAVVESSKTTAVTEKSETIQGHVGVPDQEKTATTEGTTLNNKFEAVLRNEKQQDVEPTTPSAVVVTTTLPSKSIEVASTIMHTTPQKNDEQKTENYVSTVKTTEEKTTIKPLSRSQTTARDDGAETTTETRSQDWESAEERSPACESPDCKSLSSRILSQMNHDGKHKCEDFYEYACGGRESSKDENDAWQRIVVQLPAINSGSELYLQKFKTYFSSCVDFENGFNFRKRLEGVRKILSKTGKFVINNGTEPSVNLTELFSSLVLYKAMPLFDISVDLNEFGKENVFQLKMSPPNSLLHRTEHKSAFSEIRRRCRQAMSNELLQSNNLTKSHAEFVKCQKNHSNYLDSVVNVLTEFGVFINDLDVEEYEAHIKFIRMAIEDIVDMMEYLPLKVSSGSNNEKITIKKLNEEYPIVNWKQLLEIILDNDINESSYLFITNREMFKSQLTKLMNYNDDWKIYNGLLAMFVHDMYVKFVTPSPAENIPLVCVKRTSDMMKDVANKMYMDFIPERVRKEKRAQTEHLFNRLKKTLSKSLNSVNDTVWTAESKKIMHGALETLTVVKYNLKSDKQVKKALNDKYRESNKNYILKDTTYITNTEKLLMKNSRSYYKILGKQFDPALIWSHWISVFDKEPLVIRSKKLIFAPFGMFDGTFKGMPKILVYAKVALPLARAIGRFFDHVGIADVSLPEEDKDKHKKVMEDQINSFSYQFTRYLNGIPLSFMLNESTKNLSLNNRMNDDLALRLVTDSLTENEEVVNMPFMTAANFTKEQIFFIYLTQQFCAKLDVNDYAVQLFESETLPAPLRVNSFLENSKEFSQVFNCAVGEGLNPELKRSQFPYFEIVDYPNYY